MAHSEGRVRTHSPALGPSPVPVTWLYGVDDGRLQPCLLSAGKAPTPQATCVLAPATPLVPLKSTQDPTFFPWETAAPGDGEPAALIPTHEHPSTLRSSTHLFIVCLPAQRNPLDPRHRARACAQ